MIKTTIEWYTLDEKLPFDGDTTVIGDYEVLCAVKIKVGWQHLLILETLNWIGGKLMTYYDCEYVDVTDSVKYWAYVPEIGVE